MDPQDPGLHVDLSASRYSWMVLMASAMAVLCFFLPRRRFTALEVAQGEVPGLLPLGVSRDPEALEVEDNGSTRLLSNNSSNIEILVRILKHSWRHSQTQVPALPSEKYFRQTTPVALLSTL